MTQNVDSITQPRWLYADETPRADSAPTLKEQYPSDPADTANRPNVCVVLSVDDGVWSRTDRAGNAGTYRDKQNANQRPLLADPQNQSSLGYVKDCDGSMTYQGQTITSVIDTIEHGGDDPVSYKVPRKSYVAGICRSGTAKLAVGVTADEYQTLTVDSGNVSIQQSLDPDEVWWGGNKKIEGTRLGYRIQHEDTTHFTLESFINEHRVRGRR